MKIPIQTINLFSKLDELLLGLLRTLTPSDWQRPSLARLWTVKDIAAHLLDGNIRSLSMLRDHYSGDPPEAIRSNADLVSYLNRLNADWVGAMKRTSPQVLIEQLESSGMEYVSFLQSLDLFAPAAWPVSWAGETESQNWFHIARDYTEKWHHQQQIREAVGQTAPLMTRELFSPMIETLMRALPYAYRSVKGKSGDCVKIIVSGDAGGAWALVFDKGKWELADSVVSVHAEVMLPPDVAWKLFTKGMSGENAKAKSRIIGSENLALPVFGMIAVIG